MNAQWLGSMPSRMQLESRVSLFLSIIAIAISRTQARKPLTGRKEVVSSWTIPNQSGRKAPDLGTSALRSSRTAIDLAMNVALQGHRGLLFTSRNSDGHEALYA